MRERRGDRAVGEAGGGSFKRTQDAEVIGINASGDRATASVRFGKQVSSIPLVREDGEWRLASNPAN